MKEHIVLALFEMAGIEQTGIWELPNGYWPDHEDYAKDRRASPWWLVRTVHGNIKIGWRKRVIFIDWSDTDIRAVITVDDVTKTDDMVHAWSYVKALEYLTNLGNYIGR